MQCDLSWRGVSARIFRAVSRTRSPTPGSCTTRCALCPSEGSSAPEKPAQSHVPIQDRPERSHRTHVGSPDGMLVCILCHEGSAGIEPHFCVAQICMDKATTHDDILGPGRKKQAQDFKTDCFLQCFADVCTLWVRGLTYVLRAEVKDPERVGKQRTSLRLRSSLSQRFAPIASGGDVHTRCVTRAPRSQRTLHRRLRRGATRGA